MSEIKIKSVTLSPGRWIFICPCGHPYRVMTTFKKTNRVAVYCFACRRQTGKHYRVMDERIEFSQNWNNKLGCNSFTTVRLHNPRKYCVGTKMNVYIKDYWKGTATVVDVEPVLLSEITERTARLDTNLSASDFRQVIRNMYKNRPCINWETQQVDIITLQYDKESKEPQLFK